MGSTTSEAVLGAAGLIVLAALALAVRLVRYAASTNLGKHFLKAVVADMDQSEDGERKPKPDSDGEAVVRAIAKATRDEIEPKLAMITSEIGDVKTELGAAEEREKDRSRRIDRIDVRLARLEGRVGIEPGAPEELEREDTPISNLPRWSATP